MIALWNHTGSYGQTRLGTYRALCATRVLLHYQILDPDLKLKAEIMCCSSFVLPQNVLKYFVTYMI